MKKFKLMLLTMLFLICGYVHAANPMVEIRTNMGTITLELYPDKAPLTVNNFLQYARDGAYNNTIFHRVIKGFMIQGGGYDVKLTKKPSRGSIDNEAANGLKNEIGTIAMARTSDPHSASNQFFINVANNEFLNYTASTMEGFGYCVFGRVIKGMDVVESIASVRTGPLGSFRSDVPQNPVIIQSIFINM
jgi:peptidyl-prolyl cis-trans isomerase A (cyclophilin A)/peptidyl-prolyl cis-trans isomerase B (cyclophilin B)